MSEGNGTNGRSAGRSANPWLIDHDELPGWAADNHFIVTGHRRPGGWTKDKREAAKKKNGDGTTNGKAEADVQDMAAYEHSTFYRCWRSMWAYWHNETVNIHTHFWGALFSISLLVFHLQHLLMPSLTPALPLFIRYLSHAPIFYPASLSFSTANNAPALGKDRAGQAGEWLSMAHVPTEYSHPPDTRDIAGFGSFFIGAVLCLGFSATFHCCSCHSKKISASFNKLDYIGIVFMIVGSFLPALHYGFYCHPQLQMLYTTMIVGLGGMTMYAVVNPIYATPAYRPMRAKLFISLGLSAVFPVVHVCTMYGYQTVSRIMGLSFHIFILFAAFAHYISLRQSYAFWHSVEHISGAAAAVGAHGWGREQVCSLLEAHRRG
ncbi:hypothetical protein A4X09_0g4064 [Tilletia walkeri]|uniref:Adiponectin receptor protein n=1 Tax=Tilletia walkeri TaxID=117179 RepID=A0A8X7N6T9_9BASI|nr:hypothetical protein A4X09_0g4064 [Tilletia walkeri]